MSTLVALITLKVLTS